MQTFSLYLELICFNSILAQLEAITRGLLDGALLLMISESYKSVQQKMYLSKQTNRGDLLKPHINTSRLWTNDT